MNLFKKSLLSLTAAFVVVMSFMSPPPANAGAASAYLIGKIYGNVLQNVAYTPPTTVYVALGTGTFTAQACTTEVTGGSYARVAVTSNTSNWGQASGVISNTNAITFPAPTANWGTVAYFCEFDASSGGNLLISAALTTPQAVNSGQAAPSFSSASLSWTIT